MIYAINYDISNFVLCTLNYLISALCKKYFGEKYPVLLS